MPAPSLDSTLGAHVGAGSGHPRGSRLPGRAWGFHQPGCCSDVGFSLPFPESCSFPFSPSLLRLLSRKGDESCHFFLQSAEMAMQVFPHSVDVRYCTDCFLYRKRPGHVGLPCLGCDSRTHPCAPGIQSPDTPQCAPRTATPASQAFLTQGPCELLTPAPSGLPAPPLP